MIINGLNVVWAWRCPPENDPPLTV